MHRLHWILLTALLFTATELRAETRPLPQLLRDLPPDRLLELHLDNTDFVRGFAVTVQNDSLLVKTDSDQQQLAFYALADIALVREWRSDSSRGAAWGATSGAVIVGGFGLLMGAYVASINSTSDSDLAPVLVLGGLGAGAGAVAGGLLGLGVGALSVSWHEIWPRQVTPDAERPPTYSEATRLGLFAGTARPLLENYEVSRLATRVSLRKSLGDKVSLGPEISFHAFEGSSLAESVNGTYEQGKENLLKIALVANIRRLRPGISPYGTTGFGWFLSNDAYLGAHAGGGLRWQFDGGNDLEFDIRYHFNLTDVDRGEIDRFWTIGLGLGFDL